MDRRIDVKYEKRLFDRIHRQMWLRFASWIQLFVLGPIFVAVPIAAYLTGRWTASAWIGIAAAVWFFGQPLYSYLATISRARRKYAESGKSELIYRLTDDHFAFEDDEGRLEIYWKGLYNIEKFQDGWLLQFSSKLNIILPVRDMDDEIRAFLDAKCAENRVTNPKPSQILFRSSDY